MLIWFFCELAKEMSFFCHFDFRWCLLISVFAPFAINMFSVRKFFKSLRFSLMFPSRLETMKLKNLEKKPQHIFVSEVFRFNDKNEDIYQKQKKELKPFVVKNCGD